MYCVNCGNEIDDDAQFCTACGAKVEREQVEESAVKSTVSKRTIALGAVCVLIICVIAGLLFYKVYRDKIQWNNWVESFREEMQDYYLSPEEEAAYQEYLVQAQEFKKDEDRESLKEKMQTLQGTVQKENDAYIQQLAENETKIAQEYDLSYALDTEIAEIEQSKAAYTELKEKHQYPDAIAETQHCMELAAEASRIREGWRLNIQQKDVSEYPTVRLYFTVEDEGGNAVEGLDKNMFFLSQKDAENGAYIKHEIVNAVQLNENESLNINLVADVSGSMYGNMSATKQVMNSFLNTVQFDVGDKVGLMAFDDVSYILSDFTDDQGALSNSINGMVENGLTKLYDTLIEAVQRVLPQSGAKCVIAFTDGYDNRSASTIDDVINYANMYDVPIFIIGIGDDVDTSVLRNIAESTGGFYTSVDYVDSSFENIYSEIYRVQKEVYCLEYVVDDDNMNTEQDISIYVRNTESGGTITSQYTASNDYFSILLQQYLTSYLQALSAGDYSIMKQAGFMSPDGGIAKEMKAYIKKNADTLAEQLLSCQITKIKYVDKDTYIIKTEEVYDIQQERDYFKSLKGSKQDDDKAALRLLEEDGYDLEMFEEEDEVTISIHKTRTLQGHFVIRRNDEGVWQFADYKSDYKVLDADVYTAYPTYY